jgi:uncharacterized protein YbbC (DUF1343 family)
MKNSLLIFLFFATTVLTSKAQTKNTIQPGAYQTTQYFPLLKNKRVGLFTNHTAIVNGKHLVDTLLSAGIKIQKIFTPEHGLRGDADAGEKTSDEMDAKTGIQIVSLYGKKNAPNQEDLADVDILVFDIQDVGVRFYTYISSLQLYMESAKKFNKPLIVLDRPNPNDGFIDGPVLQKSFSSFVGKNAIPIAYAMTMGEYALMLKGEHWLQEDAANNELNITIIPCSNYNHKSKYQINVAPSPNLGSMNSINWYPSTCLIEGTVLSEGRGTEHAFAFIGHPSITSDFSFTPAPRKGAMQSKLYQQKCFGWDLSNTTAPKKVDIEFIIKVYQSFPDKANFFIEPKSGKEEDYFFNKLAGNATLRSQIINNVSAVDIRKSWQSDLDTFKKIRKKYLLYKDF